MVGLVLVVSSLAGLAVTSTTAAGVVDRDEPVTPVDAYQQCYDFLTTYMPDRDAQWLSDYTLNQTIVLALEARSTMKWAQDVPFDIFLNNVLPYYMLDEARDNWRQYFWNLLADKVRDNFTSRSELAVYITQNLWSMTNVVWESGSTPLVMSPFEVITNGYASCTGHSNALVAALRSVGIPARVVGTIWNSTCTSSNSDYGQSKHGRRGYKGPDLVKHVSGGHNEDDEKDGSSVGDPGDGNHSWMEVYDDNGYWSFCDATGCNNGLNHSWFYPADTNCQNDMNSNYTIWASSYQTTGQHFVLAWDFKYQDVNGYDVTANYQTS